MSELNEEDFYFDDEEDYPPIYYMGRWWDAPMTDYAKPLPDDLKEEFLSGLCALCQEPMREDEDLLFLPYIHGHLECHLRSGLGDVQHLEGRCLCYRGAGNEVTLESDKYPTYREGAKAALQWVLDHHQGRFRS